MSLKSLTSQFVVKVQTMSPVTADAGGSWSATWVDLFAPVFARIETATSTRQVYFNRALMLVTHEVFTEQPGCRVGMRVVDSDLNVYLLIGDVIEPHTGGIETYFHFLAQQQVPLIAN